MTDGTLIDLLANGSPMVAFAGFLAWNFFQNRKQIEEMNNRQLELYRELSAEKSQAEDKVRERYERVISDLQTRDQQMRTSLENRLDKVEQQLIAIAERLNRVELKEIARGASI
mgnify:FL=1